MSEFIEGKPPDRPPRSASESAALVVVGLFFGGMILAALFKDYTIYKLSIPIFIVSWVILLVIHEFGHALMAKTVGWQVERVCLGAGKLLATRNILGMPTEFRAIPLSGYVRPRPKDLVLPQLKNCLIYAAGPGIELALVALLSILIGPDRMLSREPDLWLIAVQAFCVAAIFGAVINLIPLSHDTEHGKSPSDGLGIILAWMIPDEQYAEWIKGK